jgi:hypothetical protein
MNDWTKHSREAYISEDLSKYKPAINDASSNLRDPSPSRVNAPALVVTFYDTVNG